MRRMSFTDAVRYAALAAAMIISFTTQRDLAIAHGVPVAVAPAVPVAIDLYMIFAVRTGRDVALSVAVAVSANVAGVLTTESLSAVDTWVSAGLHGIFPVTIWRMHRHSEPGPVASTSKPDSDWPPADLWADFEDSAPEPVSSVPDSPPTAEDIKAAVSVLASTHGRPVTGRMLADHFSVSDRTGRRYLAMATA